MFSLPERPYDYSALAPTLSIDTMLTHHDKHHAAYVNKTNELVKKSGLTGEPLETVILWAHAKGETPLFNNAAQAWNHAFFWRSMAPHATSPTGDLRDALGEAFGGLDPLGETFVKEGVGHFGSGWLWLVAGTDGLKLLATHDADNTLTHPGLTPLLVCDLWEHAYYLDYENERDTFLQHWFAELADWSFAERQFAAARGQGAAFAYPAPTASSMAAAFIRQSRR
jgi:Fe-Mn family superoxide dismutase